MCRKTGPPFGQGNPQQCNSCANAGISCGVFSECCSNSLFSNMTKNFYFKHLDTNSGIKSFVRFFMDHLLQNEAEVRKCFLSCGHCGCEHTKAIYEIFFCIGHSLEWSSDSGASRGDRGRSSRELGLRK